MSRRVAVIGLLAHLVLLASVTLGASPGAVFVWGADTAQGVEGLAWVSETGVERAANVVVFAPAGLLLCAALPGAPRLVVWLLCVAVSVAVEAVQFPLPGRDATPVDVVTNATGAALGVLLHAVLAWRRRPRGPSAANDWRAR